MEATFPGVLAGGGSVPGAGSWLVGTVPCFALGIDPKATIAPIDTASAAPSAAAPRLRRAELPLPRFGESEVSAGRKATTESSLETTFAPDPMLGPAASTKASAQAIAVGNRAFLSCAQVRWNQSSSA
jgi:hypothetical protein